MHTGPLPTFESFLVAKRVHENAQAMTTDMFPDLLDRGNWDDHNYPCIATMFAGESKYNSEIALLGGTKKPDSVKLVSSHKYSPSNPAKLEGIYGYRGWAHCMEFTYGGTVVKHTYLWSIDPQKMAADMSSPKSAQDVVRNSVTVLKWVLKDVVKDHVNGTTAPPIQSWDGGISHPSIDAFFYEDQKDELPATLKGDLPAIQASLRKGPLTKVNLISRFEDDHLPGIVATIVVDGKEIPMSFPFLTQPAYKNLLKAGNKQDGGALKSVYTNLILSIIKQADRASR